MTVGVGCLILWTCRSFSSSHEFLLRQGECVKEGLRRGFAEAPAALMGPPLVIVDEPSIEVILQLVDRPIDLLAEGDPVELVQHSAMEALADAVGLLLVLVRL